jgi:hypothetical protein
VYLQLETVRYEAVPSVTTVMKTCHEQKKNYTDLTLALLETLISPSVVAGHRKEAALTLNDVAKKEVGYYLSIPQDAWPNFEEMNDWWQSHQIMEK